MKKIAVLFGAACGMAAGLLCSAVSASAASVTLTPEQTLALIGEQLPVSYWNGSEYVTDVLNYYTTGTVTANRNIYYKESYWYNNVGQTCLIYRLSSQDYYANPLVTNDVNTEYTISLNPIIDISNINQIQFSLGFSNAMRYPSGTAMGFSGAAYNKSLFAFYSDYNSDIEQAIVYNFAARDTGSGAIYPMMSYVYPSDAETDGYLSTLGSGQADPSAYRTLCFSTFQCNLLNNSKKFSWIMNGTMGGSGLTQSTGIYQPVPISQTYQTAYSTICFYITCPYISDEYVHPETDTSVPEYQDDFHLVNSNLSGILDALDAIYEEQQRNRNVLTNAAADINLLQQNVFAMYSDVHGMAGDVHSIAGALGESSLLDIGAGHNAFDSAAESAFSNADSIMQNDLPSDIVDTNTSVLGFVWDFIQAFHLDAIFGIITMLLIIHFTIFKR